MKKIISLILCVCLVFALGATSFADDTAISVSYERKGKTVTDNYSSHKKGWTAAIEHATDKNYKNVSVTLEKDWVAVDGEFDSSFFNDTGFDWDAIHFPGGTEITVDLNGHTIDRGLTEWEFNGEVMCIDEGTNITIKNGTIKGGFSSSGASGIHVKGGKLLLENVNIIENRSDNDDGVGIAVHGGNVTMVGGSIADNAGVVGEFGTWGGAIAVFDGNVTLKNVSIRNNKVENPSEENDDGAIGGAIYIEKGSLTLEYCDIFDNHSDSAGGAIRQDGGSLTLTHCNISGNSTNGRGGAVDMWDGMLTLEKCNVYDNSAVKGASGIQHRGGVAVVSGCYFRGDVIDESANLKSDGTVDEKFVGITWQEESDTMVNHTSRTGSVISTGSIAIIAGAVVVAAAGAAVIIRRKKSSASAEENETV